MIYIVYLQAKLTSIKAYIFWFSARILDTSKYAHFPPIMKYSVWLLKRINVDNITYYYNYALYKVIEWKFYLSFIL